MLKRLATAARKDYLITTGIIFFIGSVLTAVLNYGYHLMMGRMLGPAEYGVLGSLFSVIYLVTFSSSAFNLVLSKYSAEFSARDEKGFLKYLIQRGLFKISLVALIILLIYFVATPFIAEFLNLDSIVGLIIVGVIAYLSLIASILGGTLNGLKIFTWQNASGIAATSLKFSLAILLVFLGFGVNGALIAVLAGSILGITITAPIIYREIRKEKSVPFNSKAIFSYFMPVLIAGIISVLIITVDQMLVKHLLSSTDAGLYAAAGNIAKMIWFGSGFLCGAFFPQVVSLKSQGKSAQNLLVRALFYTGFIAVIGCIAYFTIPTFIVSMMYGKSYLPIVSLIGLFGVSMALFSVNNIFMTYNLASEKYGFIYILAISIIFEVVGILLYHSSLIDVIKVFFATNLFNTLGYLLYNREDFLGGINEV